MDKIMAESVQTKLPAEMVPIVKEIKAYREKNLEPTSYKSIVIDALKDYYNKVCPTVKA
jgi:hypothetical protein